MASPRASIPKSPCSASAGCRKNDGVPVLDSVAEIFRPISPDFPIPVTATRPLHSKSTSTALVKVASSRAITSCSARASISKTLRAVSKLTIIPAFSLRFLNWGAAMLRPYEQVRLTTFPIGGPTKIIPSNAPTIPPTARAATHSPRRKAPPPDYRASPGKSHPRQPPLPRAPVAR